MAHPTRSSQDARLIPVRIDLRGLQSHSRELYPEFRRQVTYTVEVVRKVRKRASSRERGL
jgi:hypothetical protein